MILTAPDDRQFPNGPAFAKGDPVDVAELAASLGVDAAQLGADLLDQGWPKATAKKAAAAKKAAPKTSPAPAGDDNTPDPGDDTEES